MTTNYRVSRGGEVKMSVMLDTHADGTLWSITKPSMPLLDSEAEGFRALGKDAIVALIKADKYNEIPADCFARVGVSASGLEVKSYDEIRAKARAAMTPAQIERERINGLYAKARARRDADDDTSDYYRLSSQADAALKAWRETYPKDAAQERAASLEAQADHEEDIARGALLYDADGDIDAAGQQARHDEHMAKAADLRRQAAELRA